MIIREIKKEDFKETGEMIQKVLRTSYKDLYPKELIESFCTKYELENFTERAKKIKNFIAVKDSKIIGVIGLSNNQLRGFYVDPDYQGQKVGRKLYDYLEQIARSQNFKKIILEGSPIGEPIYKKFGFRKVGSVAKERAGIEFIDAKMEKEL